MAYVMSASENMCFLLEGRKIGATPKVYRNAATNTVPRTVADNHRYVSMKLLYLQKVQLE